MVSLKDGSHICTVALSTSGVTITAPADPGTQGPARACGPLCQPPLPPQKKKLLISYTPTYDNDYIHMMQRRG